MIQVENVSKVFKITKKLKKELDIQQDSIKAIDNVSFECKPGRIFSLMGPNGAGKSTLFNLISGVDKPDTGTIKFADNNITGLAPYKICQKGIARTFQLVRPFSQLSPLENVMVGSSYGSGFNG